MPMIPYLLIMALFVAFPGYSFSQNAARSKKIGVVSDSLRAKLPDSVTVPASYKYANPSLFTVIMLGSNYRKEWSTPATMPVFDIKTYNGGFRITELGGGQQTKSLRMVDKNGREWVLRTADKDVEKAITKVLRNTLVEEVVQDMISASHPYACLAIPDLANAAGVVVAKPKVFFVPNDEAFGKYQKLFANQVCFLEERAPTPDKSETEDTEDMMEKVREENDHLILPQSVFRARLLDMLIADWDRHPDQWRWGKAERGNRNFYYAVPKDRDFAFFNSHGLLVKFASLTTLPHMKGFGHKPTGIKRLSAKTWSLDAMWLNSLSREDWTRLIKDFQRNVTDSVIHAAVTKIPREVYAISGAEIEKKLRQRRDELLTYALRYYDFLATHVHVLGSEEKELFKLTGDGKKVTVTMYQGGREERSRIIYRRTLTPDDTKHLSLIGYGGGDVFDIDPSVSSPINVNIKGTKKDDYHLKGKIKMNVEKKKEKKKKSSA